MKDETKIWIRYSNENLDSSKILLKSKLFNPCLQNVQQAVEKSLKAVLVEKDIHIKKTHDILELKKLLEIKHIKINISDEECDFLNTIYLPSKYPLGGVIPNYDPDTSVCLEGIEIAEQVKKSVDTFLKKSQR